jgi:hypothetical protein
MFLKKSLKFFAAFPDASAERSAAEALRDVLAGIHSS